MSWKILNSNGDAYNHDKGQFGPVEQGEEFTLPVAHVHGKRLIDKFNLDSVRLEKPGCHHTIIDKW